MKSSSFFLLLSVLLAACGTQRKTLYTNYLQYGSDSSGKRLNMPEPLVQKGDLLSIKVYSQSADPRTDIPYNLPEPGTGGSSGPSATGGFLVDEEGNIEYPRIGTLHAAGLNKAALAQQIKERLASELKNPSVIVRFLNYRVTVLGEVRSPGSFTVPTERVTILEALGLAGDVSEYGNRNVVQVARERGNEVEIGRVDLTSKDLFQSPYFRLQQNDVVFVEQNRRKIDLQEQQATAQRLGIITGIISTLAIVFSLIRR